jgi:hypothetical protein
MENPKPGWTPGAGKSTFRWGLSKITDVNGNETVFYYVYDAGQMYPAYLMYNVVASRSSQVQFIFEPRTDTNITFKAGFRIETRQRLSAIVVSNTKISSPPLPGAGHKSCRFLVVGRLGCFGPWN